MTTQMRWTQSFLAHTCSRCGQPADVPVYDMTTHTVLETLTEFTLLVIVEDLLLVLKDAEIGWTTRCL